MERQKGDFLGEVLIVIALLLIMAGTAIPNLLRTAIADHASSAVRTISGSDTRQAVRVPENRHF